MLRRLAGGENVLFKRFYLGRISTLRRKRDLFTLSSRVVLANRKKSVVANLGLLSESFSSKMHFFVPVVTFVLKFFLFFRVKTFFSSFNNQLGGVNVTISA